jgi:hypothetical protein
MPKKTIKKPGANLPSDLRLPIQVKSLGLWTGSLTRAEIRKQLSEQAEKKLIALLKHFNIPLHSPHKWKHLSWCLAEELRLMETTFKPPKRPHASSVWPMGEHLLVKRMDEITAKGRLTAMAAAKTLIARHAEYKHLEPKSLVNRYSEAKKRMQRGGLRPLWAS